MIHKKYNAINGMNLISFSSLIFLIFNRQKETDNKQHIVDILSLKAKQKTANNKNNRLKSIVFVILISILPFIFN